MTNRSKGIGSEWETRLLSYFRSRGWRAERLALAGANDEGDLFVGIDLADFVVEAKAEKKIDLASYVKEAELEAFNHAKARGRHTRDGAVDPASWLVIVKRRNQPVNKAYVVTTLEEFIRQVEG